MKNVKGVIEGIGNIFGNPKLRGIAQIIFWIIFFFIVAMIFRSSKASSSRVPKKNNNTNITNNEKNGVVNSYEYEYQYKDDNGNINIIGTHFENKESFSMNGTKYYEISGIYYDANTKTKTDIGYAIDEWKYERIKNITNHNPYTNQTKYKNGITKYEYNIEKSIYNNYYIKTYPNDIALTITKNGDLISDATIDYGFGIVNIKYTNINEIDSLDINLE